MPSYDRALHALRTWLDSWSGIGRIAIGMARQGYDLQLMRYDERGWRATYDTHARLAFRCHRRYAQRRRRTVRDFGSTPHRPVHGARRTGAVGPLRVLSCGAANRPPDRWASLR
jgi:hypothetical protein